MSCEKLEELTREYWALQERYRARPLKYLKHYIKVLLADELAWLLVTLFA